MPWPGGGIASPPQNGPLFAAGFARKLAAKKFNLALFARKVQPFDELAAELRSTAVQVRTLSADLSRPDALERVRSITEDVEIGYLIYVAGANSIRGNFFDLAPELYHAVFGMNCTVAPAVSSAFARSTMAVSIYLPSV